MGIRFFVSLLLTALTLQAQLPPLRSTLYDGSASVQMRHAADVYAPNLDLTIEAWVYREDAARCETIVSQDFTRSFWLGFCGDSLRLYRNGGRPIDADRNVPAQRWTHVAAVYDGTSQQARFYIDGQLVSTKSTAATNAPLNLPIYLGMTPGTSPAFLTYPFKGALDEVRIWSRARVRDEINATRFEEIGATNGLVAVFRNGGDYEVLRARRADSVARSTAQVYGILPRNLTIPLRPAFDPVNGDVDGIEYQGAELMPMRFWQGTNEMDVPIRLNGFVSSGTTYIYVGFAGLRPVSDVGHNNRGEFSWYYGTAESDRGFPDSGDSKASTYYNTQTNRFWQGDGSSGFTVVDTSSTATIGKTFCEGDVHPICVEMRGAMPATQPRAMMFELFWPGQFTILDRRFYAPMNASPSDPRTWPTVRIGSTIGAAETIRISAKVQEPARDSFPARPLAGVTVRLLHGNSLDEIDTTVTGADGVALLEGVVRTNTPVTVELGAPTYWPRLAARGVPGTGTMPSTSTGGTVRFAGCTGCDYADVVFDTQFIPEGRTVPSGFDPPGNHFKRIVLRDTPLKERPPSSVTIFGTNLHPRLEVYLTQCDRVVFNDVASTPQEATGCSASSFWRLPSVLNFERTGLTATFEAPAAPINTPLRLLVRDLAARDTRRQWTYAPGSVTLGLPPFPLLHGFVFDNERDGTQFDEFSGVYQWNAYDCLVPPGFVIPPVQTCPGCRIPNPIYLTWYAVFTGWVEAMTGSCLGMSSTSLLFARGDLDTEAFNPAVHFANGFRGFSSDPLANPLDESLPPKPQEHRFRVCDYSEPVNLWAHIHRNQAVQTSQEFLNSVISQMSGTGIGTDSYSIAGDPSRALSQIRSGLGNILLCFQNQADFFQSHCVVPYAVVDGKGLDPNGDRLVDRADSSIIRVYDSNWPEQERFFEVNRTTNEFRYAFGWRRVVVPGVSTNIVPVMWGGRGMYATPLSIWRNARTMPGVELQHRGLSLIFFGSADATYSDDSGGKWGWNTSGAFTDTYLGAKAWAPTAARPEWPPANQGRSVMFFPPTNRPPADIQVNVRGPKWHFHSAEGGVVVDLEVAGGVAGDTDTLKLTRRAEGILIGMRYGPQRRAVNFKPSLGLNLGTNPAVVFRWEGLELPGGKAIELVGKPDQFGAQVINDAGETLRPTLRILRADGDGLKTNLFGPVEIPAGAVQLLALPQTGSASLRVELDTNRDGTPESTQTLTPQGSANEAPRLAATLKEGKIMLSWPGDPAKWGLESSPILGPGSSWASEAASPQTSNGVNSVELPVTGAARYFRLRGR